MGHRISSRPKKVHDLGAVCFTGIAGFERSQERLDRDMEERLSEFFTGGDWKCTS